MTAKEKLTALADAIREKTSITSPLSLDAMTAAVSALSAGSLPEGWSTGEFSTDGTTEDGGFRIEHGLGRIPEFVLILRCQNDLISQSVHGVIRINTGEELDSDFGSEIGEEGYVASACSQRILYDNSSATDISATAGEDGWDSRLTLEVPTLSQATYTQGCTYLWLCISFS